MKGFAFKLLFFIIFSCEKGHSELTSPFDHDTLQKLVIEAISKVDSPNNSQWSFQREVFKNNKPHIEEVFDPSNVPDKQWSIQSYKGQAPSEKQTLSYLKKKKRKRDDNDNQFSMNDLSQIVDIDSISLLNQDNQTISIAFRPRIKKLSSEEDKLRGILSIDSKSGLLNSLNISNEETLYPKVSVSIKTFELSIQFSQHQGESLPLKSEMLIKGKAAFFKSINKQVRKVYSNYKRANERWATTDKLMSR